MSATRSVFWAGFAVRLLGVAAFGAIVGFAMLAPATGCIDAGEGGTSSSSGGTLDAGDAQPVVTVNAQACLDEADAYAMAAMRCGGDLASERAAFINDVAGGDCNKVTIRDVTELRTMCLPTFTTISCDDLTNARFAPGCAQQIQH